MTRRRIPFDLDLANNPRATLARQASQALQKLIDDQSPDTLACGFPVSNHIVELGYNVRSVVVTAGAVTQIIQAQTSPHTYIIINPGEPNGFLPTGAIFSSALRVTGTYNSASFNVSPVDRIGLFLNITAVSGGYSPTLTIATQSQDPVSAGWATTHTDIFSGVVTTTGSPFYYLVPENGTDQNFRLQAVVGAGSVTFSVGYVNKGLDYATIGNVVYIGQQNVNQGISFPLLAGQEKTICLQKSVPLYAFTPSNDMVIHIWQLE